MELDYPRQILEKYSSTKFRKNSSRGSPVVPCGRTVGQTDGRTTDRQTDMTKLILDFRFFANTPKITWSSP